MEEDFQKIYETFGKPVYRFLLSLTGDQSMAEELLQETFFQAFLHIRQFEGRCSVFTWLCQIGKNAWIKECKRQQRFTVYEEKDKHSTRKEHEPEQYAVEKETIRELQNAILNLHEPYQNVFILHVYGERKFAEIASLYGKSESWARVTYFRAKAKISQEVSI